MKKKVTYLKTLVLWVFIVQVLSGIAQPNYVKNPSFEETQNGCPDSISVIKDLTSMPVASRDQLTYHCKHWKTVTDGTSDYFNKCNTTACIVTNDPRDNWSVIHASQSMGNYGGKQEPKNLNDPNINDPGEAYAGFQVMARSQGGMDMEYIEGELEPLGNGVYEVEFYVSLAEISNYALRNIGFAIVKGDFEQKKPSFHEYYLDYPINLKSHALYKSPVRNTNLFDDKTEWMRVWGTFTAQGGEDRIIIGYFGNRWDEHIDSMHRNNMAEDAVELNVETYTQACANINYTADKYAYYYVDAVSVKIAGNDICTKDCNKITPEFSFVNDPDEAKCCWAIKVNNQSGSCTDIYKVKMLENGVEIFSKDFGDVPLKPGMPITAIGTHCFTDVKGPRTITLQYIGAREGSNENHTVMCEYTTTLDCPCNSCGQNSVPGHPLHIMPVKVTTGNPQECCFDLFVRNESNCDLYVYDGLGFSVDNSLNIPGDIITVKEKGQWNGYQWGQTAVRFSKSREIIKAKTTEYLGTICINPAISPTILHTFGLTKNSNVAGGYNVCSELADQETLNCNEPPNECCNYLYASMFEDNSSTSGCLCKFTITAPIFTVPAGCGVARVEYIPLSQGGVITNQWVAPSGFFATLCSNPQVSVVSGTETFTAKVKIIFYNAAGEIICVKEVSQTCTRDFGNGGGGGGGGGTSGKREDTDPTLDTNGTVEKSSAQFSCMPNPFGSETVFTYTVNTDALVKLELLDIQGKLIEQVENTRKTAGEYKVKYLNKKLRPGVYAARLTIGETSQTIKLLIE